MLSSGVLAAYGISLFGLSYPFFGNLATGRWGVMPLLTDRLRSKEKLSALQKVSLFAPFFNAAKNDMVVNSVFALPAIAFVAYNERPGSTERLLAGIAFTFLFLVGPYTNFVLMPTNRKLLKYNETSDTAAAEAEANKLFVFWENAHLVRHSLMAVAWTSFVACIALHMH